MRVILTIKADELKIAQLLAKFSEDYQVSYKLTRQSDGFLMDINTNDLGELVRRLNHLKDSSFVIKEIHGGGLLDRLNVKATKTNVDALIGKVTVAKTDIDPFEGGVVKLEGEIWFCRPAREKMIKEGSRVVVVGIEGVSLLVEEVK